MELPIEAVEVPSGRRALQDVTELAASIADVGLLHPIVVTGDHRLVAGRHRLEACKRLGWTHVPVTLLKGDAVDAELAEIDENLRHTPLKACERMMQFARHKRLHETKHPETKHGVVGRRAWDLAREAGERMGVGRRANVPSSAAKTSGNVQVATNATWENAEETAILVQDSDGHASAHSGGGGGDDRVDRATFDAARSAGVSERTVQADVDAFDRLAPAVRDLLPQSPIADSRADILRLSRLPADQQLTIVRRLVATGGAMKVKDAIFLETRAAVAAESKGAGERARIRLADALPFLESLEPGSVDLLVTSIRRSPADLTAFARAWVSLALSRVNRAGRMYILLDGDEEETAIYARVLRDHKPAFSKQLLAWRGHDDYPTLAAGYSYSPDCKPIFHVRGCEAPPLRCPLADERAAIHVVSDIDVLAERLVRHATERGELVVDPFADSGAFLVAAAKLGRRALGCESSANLVSAAEARGCVREV